MRVLCLHGRGTNAKVLRTQLAPTIYELGRTKNLEFQFVDAPFAVPPFPGIAEQYEGPFFGFFEQELGFAQLASIARTTTQKSFSPEDHCREIRQHGLDRSSSSTCDFLSQLVQQHSERPFDGILGFSEGASVAASYILREASKGNYPFRFAIFICATHIFDWRTSVSLVADETSERIDIPTAHIVGSRDPGYKGSLALFNLCTQYMAGMFDHGGSHGIPWSTVATKGIAQGICEVIERSESRSTKLIP